MPAAGYQLSSDGDSVACAAGHVKAAPGASTCSRCGAGTYAPKLQSTKCALAACFAMACTYGALSRPRVQLVVLPSSRAAWCSQRVGMQISQLDIQSPPAPLLWMLDSTSPPPPLLPQVPELPTPQDRQRCAHHLRPAGRLPAGPAAWPQRQTAALPARDCQGMAIVKPNHLAILLPLLLWQQGVSCLGAAAHVIIASCSPNSMVHQDTWSIRTCSSEQVVSKSDVWSHRAAGARLRVAAAMAWCTAGSSIRAGAERPAAHCAWPGASSTPPEPHAVSFIIPVNQVAASRPHRGSVLSWHRHDGAALPCLGQHTSTCQPSSSQQDMATAWRSRAAHQHQAVHMELSCTVVHGASPAVSLPC